jgi:hypothetical protein
MALTQFIHLLRQDSLARHEIEVVEEIHKLSSTGATYKVYVKETQSSIHTHKSLLLPVIILEHWQFAF